MSINKKRMRELRKIMDEAFEKGFTQNHKHALDEWMMLMRREHGDEEIDRLLEEYKKGTI